MLNIIKLHSQIFRKLIYRLRHFILFDAYFKNELKRSILLFNLLILVTSSLLFILFTHIFRQSDFRLGLVLTTLFFYLLSIWLFWNGHIKISNSIMNFVSIILVTIAASISGESSGEVFFIFPIVTFVFTTFSYREKWLIAFFLVLVACSITFLEITHFSFFQSFVPQESVNDLYTFRIITLGVSIFLICSHFYFLLKLKEETELKLYRTSTFLKKKILQLNYKNTELDNFVAKTSHDLKSPLNSILGLIEVMKTSPKSEDLNEYLRLQEKTALKMKSFISEMLDIALNNDSAIHTKPIDFELMINEIFDEFRFIDHAEKIRKNVQLSSSLIYYSDPKRLEIVLSNIISNSIRYIDLKKEDHYIEIDIHVTDEWVKISVKDNGIGIQQEHIAHIFEMFYKVNARTSQKSTGLGMHIVKETINKLNGKIDLTSIYGEWTCFEITIPNRKAQQELSPN